jgi:flagellar basal-body rod protein FlgF
MDKLLYVAMTGATQTMLAQGANNNNLANVSTPGFRADYAHFRSMPVYGAGYPSRVYAMTERSGTDFKTGPMNATGNEMDVAINGEGWLAVQAKDGTEAYTRAGDLRIAPSGLLVTGGGNVVLGDSGPISIPPSSGVQFGTDGTISNKPLGEQTTTLNVLGRLKLVNPPLSQLRKGEDGLMRLPGGKKAPADANVKIVSNMLEGSNVNIAEALVNMISLQRQFEMQVRIMHDAEQNADSAKTILQMA